MNSGSKVQLYLGRDAAQLLPSKALASSHSLERRGVHVMTNSDDFTFRRWRRRVGAAGRGEPNAVPWRRLTPFPCTLPSYESRNQGTHGEHSHDTSHHTHHDHWRADAILCAIVGAIRFYTTRFNTTRDAGRMSRRGRRRFDANTLATVRTVGPVLADRPVCTSPAILADRIVCSDTCIQTRERRWRRWRA